MELYKEILTRVLEKEEIHVIFPNLQIDPSRIVAMECYRVLRNIKEIVEDESLSDPECYLRIEEIVLQLEELGSDGKNRHDFL